MALLKAWFFGSQIFANPGLQQIAYWVLTGIIVAALVRRFNHITFLEAFILAIVWTLFDLLFDLVLLSPYTGLSIFSASEYWWGLLIMVAAIMALHKKHHIKIRHELRAKH